MAYDVSCLTYLLYQGIVSNNHKAHTNTSPGRARCVVAVAIRCAAVEAWSRAGASGPKISWRLIGSKSKRTSTDVDSAHLTGFRLYSLEPTNCIDEQHFYVCGSQMNFSLKLRTYVRARRRHGGDGSFISHRHASQLLIIAAASHIRQSLYLSLFACLPHQTCASLFCFHKTFSSYSF